MAAGCERALGGDGVEGEVIVADGYGAELESIRVTEAGHPLPDARGVQATRRITQQLERTPAHGVLCVISGGASSLLPQPRPPVTLEDKIVTTQLLLASGADIDEFNCVRKHLSTVKGGGLLRHGRSPMVGLLISDVVGDDPGTIGSGPTAPDVTTFGEAWAILERYELIPRLPRSVLQLFHDGRSGRIPETVKPSDPLADRCRNWVIGSNRMALAAAASAARRCGWAVHLEEEPLTGDTRTAARSFAGRLHALVRRPAVGPLCVLAGGETTVRVTGRGRGGRNQEFALALADALAGDDILVLSAGTDGIDGPTDAAGAFVDGTTLQRAIASGQDVERALADNDSYGFFAALGDLFAPGPTGTNVMDIKIALIPTLPSGGTVGVGGP